MFFKKLYLSYIDYNARYFGVQKATPEQQAFVASVAQELGIKRPIEIRLMNNTAMTHFGLMNAFAYLDRCIFISNAFFNNLSGPMKRWVIGHELMHIYHNHCIKRSILFYSKALFNIAFSIFLVGNSITALFGQTTYIVSNYIQCLIISFIWFCIGVCFELAYRAYCRKQEFQADKESSLLLRATQEGIDFCVFKMQESSGIFKFYNYSTRIKRMMALHPSYQERIDFFKKLSTEVTL